MKAADAIQHLIEESTWTKTRVSNALGFATLQAFKRRERATYPRTDFLGGVAGKLGYRLALVPDGEKLPKGSILLDDTIEPEQTSAMADEEIES